MCVIFPYRFFLRRFLFELDFEHFRRDGQRFQLLVFETKNGIYVFFFFIFSGLPAGGHVALSELADVHRLLRHPRVSLQNFANFGSLFNLSDLPIERLFESDAVVDGRLPDQLPNAVVVRFIVVSREFVDNLWVLNLLARIYTGEFQDFSSSLKVDRNFSLNFIFSDFCLL